MVLVQRFGYFHPAIVAQPPLTCQYHEKLHSVRGRSFDGSESANWIIRGGGICIESEYQHQPKAAIRIFEGVRELCESVLMGYDEFWVLQRAPAVPI